MARKARQRISYVLPLADQKGGHRLGVNGLAVDDQNSILYSGGRDGVICAWDLHTDLWSGLQERQAGEKKADTTWRQQVQAHTHWINDIALCQGNQALVSASSDITVKIWRPAASDGLPPQSIGVHTDYVKTLAVPGPSSSWVASGGLDRKICIWDLAGAGQQLCINVGDDEAGSSLLSREKGSVYALGATENLLASGGPENTAKLWDTRSGKRITKLVGHTDNIRDLLVSSDGTMIMTASSDRTVKVWSTSAGRCMYTLTMHDASVWSLFSSDPDLSVFYSSDRNGMIAKTDTRNTIELDEGVSVAVCQEHEGVHKVVVAGSHLWTATSRPSVNRWADVDTDNTEVEIPENYSMHRVTISNAKTRISSSAGEFQAYPPRAFASGAAPRRKIPLKHALRLSNTAFFPTPTAQVGDASVPPAAMRRGSKDIASPDLSLTQPMHSQPEFSIEGQNGLIKHVMLNDRKRVLTLDTAGDVMMWDLLKCIPIRSYGKRHLDDVKEEVTTNTTVANWCSVDTRTGSVAVTLEENNAFDAEIYADELEIEEEIDFREDQRINLGKWVLRYLFSGLITEEILRDQIFRQDLLEGFNDKALKRDNAPISIQLPERNGIPNGWHTDGPPSATTVRPPTNGTARPTTPGFSIGMATPAPAAMNIATSAPFSNPKLSPTAEERAPSEKRSSHASQQSTDHSSDYFSSNRVMNNEATLHADAGKMPSTPMENAAEPSTPGEADGAPTKDTPSKEGLWGKKFKKGMSFSGGFSGSFSGMKKLGRVQTGERDKPAVVEAKAEGEVDDRASETSNVRVVEDNLLGTVQKIRHGYEDLLQQHLQAQQARENGLPSTTVDKFELTSAILPSLPAETPVLKPPLNTTILIQEDRPEAGGVVDLFEGTVGEIGEMCELVEKAAPMWLGDVLLRNTIPVKDVVKISFVLEPLSGSGLISLAGVEGNNRLNANRMLRARKVLAYVAERIEQQPVAGQDGEIIDQEREMKPDEYLELWCHDQLIPPTMTLATIRQHIWRGGGDIVMHYSANGKKTIIPPPLPPQQMQQQAGNSGYPPIKPTPFLPGGAPTAASATPAGETTATVGGAT